MANREAAKRPCSRFERLTLNTSGFAGAIFISDTAGLYATEGAQRAAHRWTTRALSAASNCYAFGGRVWHTYKISFSRDFTITSVPGSIELTEQSTERRALHLMVNISTSPELAVTL